MDLFDFDQDHSHDYRTDALFLDPTSGTAITSPPDEHHHH
jgi:acid phosphatase/phospholipase C